MESESVSLRLWPLIEERDLHFFILRCSVVGSLLPPIRNGNHIGITWESHGTYLGRFRAISCPRILFPCDNVRSTSHSKDNERRLKAGACFNLSSAKLLNSELSVAV